MDEVCSVCCFGDGDSFAYDQNPNSFNDSPNFSDYPPQPQYQTYSCELCGNDAHYGYDCPPQVPFLLKLINDLQILNGIQLKQEEQAAKVSSQYWKPPIFYDDDDDDDEESYFPLRDIIYELPLVKDLNLTPSESEDLSDNESRCDMPVCDDSSSKNEGLDDIEFTGKLASIDPIPAGIVEADPEEDIRLIEKLLNDDSSPHSLEELNSEIPDAIIESFSPSPIPVEDSDSLMEKIDIFLASDDSIPPGIRNDDYDSEGDVLFLEELLNNDSLSCWELNSVHLVLLSQNQFIPFMKVARLVVVHIIILSVKPPVASLKGTFMLLRETKIQENKNNQNQCQNRSNQGYQNQGFNQNQGQNFNQNQTPNFPSTDEILRQHMIASDAKFQLLANQITKIEKAFSERPRGVLPSNTIPNPREQINSITTRSGLTTAEPFIPSPVPPTPREEVEK
ncbi:hypothetical protein Tco_1330707 [Tanacetum coccineum]